jgi:hypothetical protein
MPQPDRPTPMPDNHDRGLDVLGLGDIDPEAIRKLSSVDDLRRVGRDVAERDVRAEHYRAKEALHARELSEPGTYAPPGP